MKNLTLILDIDDVSRNLREQIIAFAFVHYHGQMDDFKYFYQNKKCRDFMDWFKDYDEYYHLFENAKWNTPLFHMINTELKDINLFFLSTNKHEKAKEVTKKQLMEHFNHLDSFKKNKDNSIIFIDSAKDKVNHVLNNVGQGAKFGSDSSTIFFVDDRLDTVKSFAEKGLMAFWYTEWITPEEQEDYMKLYGEYDYRGNFKILSKMLFLWKNKII